MIAIEDRSLLGFTVILAGVLTLKPFETAGSLTALGCPVATYASLPLSSPACLYHDGTSVYCVYDRTYGFRLPNPSIPSGTDYRCPSEDLPSSNLAEEDLLSSLFTSVFGANRPSAMRAANLANSYSQGEKDGVISVAAS